MIPTLDKGTATRITSTTRAAAPMPLRMTSLAARKRSDAADKVEPIPGTNASDFLNVCLAKVSVTGAMAFLMIFSPRTTDVKILSAQETIFSKRSVSLENLPSSMT